MKTYSCSKYYIVILLLIIPFSVLFSQQREPRPPGNRSHEILPKPARLTLEQEAAAIEYIRVHKPKLYELLQKIKLNKPQGYNETLQMAYRQMVRMEEMQQRDPEMYERVKLENKLDQDAQLLAQAIQKLEEADEIEAQKKELKQKLNELFDLRQENRLDEIRKLEQRIQELKENNAKRLANKELIVQRRMNELLGKRDELDW